MSGPWVGCTSGGGPVSASKEYFGDGHQSFRQLAFRRDLAEFLVAAHPKVWRLRDIHVATKLNVPSWAGPRPTRHYVGDQMTRVGPPVVRKGSTYGDRRAGGRGQLLNAGCPSSNASRHCACRSTDGEDAEAVLELPHASHTGDGPACGVGRISCAAFVLAICKRLRASIPAAERLGCGGCSPAR
jgi:hypothetical protein